jgi:hypothetical protein
VSGTFTNPLYQGKFTGGTNPLYEGPTHKYPSQLIIQFLEGDPGDAAITNGSEALKKHGSDLGISTTLVTVRKSGNMFRTFSKKDVATLQEAMGSINTHSRVYVRGHGDWQSQKIGAWGPHDVADLLAECGMPAVAVVSVTGCELGRDKGTAKDARIGNSVNSFASKFHKRLGEKHGIRTKVYARVFCVAVGNPVKGAGVNDPSVRGHKATFDEDDNLPGGFSSGRHRVHSKIMFKWVGNKQERVVL